MDVARPRPRRRYRRLAVVAVVVTALLVAGRLAIGRLRGAPASVPRASVWTATVERGEMRREVQGNGSLVPEQIQWITAVTSARVERIFVRPGAPVEPDTLVLDLGNPELELQALEAERQVAAARAELANLRATLKADLLAQEAVVAGLRVDLGTARRQARAQHELGDQGYTSRHDELAAAAQVEALAGRLTLEERRLETLGGGMRTRLDAQAAQVARLETIAAFRRRELEALHVRAGVAGVLQELPLEAGQWVTPGALLAKVARPDELKAQLSIPETQARDVAIGQLAHIDTRNGIIDGRVTRIDPAARGGTVTVDVAFAGPLPRGARPSLAIVGTVELERLPDVLYVRRPAFAQPDATSTVFRVEPDRPLARRVTVRFGRASATTIEVLGGLTAGETIILSDMSMWDGHDQLALE